MCGRYLETIGRPGEYSAISKGLGDPEGRWQAFLDLSQTFWTRAKTDQGLQKMGIDEKEAGEIMQAAYAAMRMRVIPNFGKLHHIMRELKNYTEHGKEHLLEVARNIKHELPQEEITDDKGELLPQDAIDEKWKNQYKTEITRSFIKARDASESGSEKNAPITLLSDALKKLNHENMAVYKIDVADLRDALKCTNKIKTRSETLKKEIYERMKKAERGGPLKPEGKA